MFQVLIFQLVFSKGSTCSVFNGVSSINFGKSLKFGDDNVKRIKLQNEIKFA